MNPPVVRHFSPHGDHKCKVHPPVLVRDPESRQIEWPYKLLTWDHGYTCMFKPQGFWVKRYVLVHPVRPPDDEHQDKSVIKGRHRSREGNPCSPFYPFPFLNTFIDFFQEQ